MSFINNHKHNIAMLCDVDRPYSGKTSFRESFKVKLLNENLRWYFHSLLWQTSLAVFLTSNSSGKDVATTLVTSLVGGVDLHSFTDFPFSVLTSTFILVHLFFHVSSDSFSSNGLSTPGIPFERWAWHNLLWRQKVGTLKIRVVTPPTPDWRRRREERRQIRFLRKIPPYSPQRRLFRARYAQAPQKESPCWGKGGE